MTSSANRRALTLAALAGSAIMLAQPVQALPGQSKPKKPAAKAQTRKPAAAAKPVTLAVTVPVTPVKLMLVKVPAGSITVADPAAPGKTRTVKVGPFWIGQTEITWDIFDVYLLERDKKVGDLAVKTDGISRPSKPYIPPDHNYGHEGYAAIHLTSNSVTQLCKWLSVVTGKKFRLPTEAEWEYAARAGAADGKLPKTKEALGAVAWVQENATETTHPVGKKLPNGWGLFDTLGNAAEWCTDLKGTPVLCGGAFTDTWSKVNWRTRAYQTADWQADDAHFPKSEWWLANGEFAGIRVVCDP